MLTKQRNGYYNTKMGGQFTYLVTLDYTKQQKRDSEWGARESRRNTTNIYIYMVVPVPWNAL